MPWCQHQNLQWSHSLVTTAANGETGFTGQSGPREEDIGDISLPSTQQPSQGSSPAITNMHTCMQLVWGVGQSSSNATLGSSSSRAVLVCVQPHSLQSFCVYQLPKTDTGAAARCLQQSPGEKGERGPGRRQLCCSDLTGSDTTAGGQRRPPPSAVILDFSSTALQWESHSPSRATVGSQATGWRRFFCHRPLSTEERMIS